MQSCFWKASALFFHTNKAPVVIGTFSTYLFWSRFYDYDICTSNSNKRPRTVYTLPSKTSSAAWVGLRSVLLNLKNNRQCSFYTIMSKIQMHCSYKPRRLSIDSKCAICICQINYLVRNKISYKISSQSIKCYDIFVYYFSRRDCYKPQQGLRT